MAETFNDHIVKSFDEQLARLNELVSRMGGLAENQLESAIEALVNRDRRLAGEVIAGDKNIDAMETEIDAMAMRMIALRQPMGPDLRRIFTALKIAPDLERIGDYAKNVAKRAIALAQVPPVKPVSTVPRMGRMVRAMIKDVLDAYASDDVAKARDVWERDRDVDDVYDSLFRELLTYMMEDPRNISACTHLLFVAKNIERIGDLATNVAERIHFQVVGETLDEDRPKADRASITVIEPRTGLS